MGGALPGMDATNAPVRPRLARAKPWLALVAAGLVVAAGLGWWFFAPKPSTSVDEAAPDGTVLARGAFEGADGFHHAQGTVAWVRAPDGTHVLRFEGYDARAGPDVYFWLVPATAKADVGDAEATGLEVRTPGGFMDGQATLRGNFNVPLPAGVEPSKFGGVVAWCNQYGVLFAFAPLAPA